jgi:glycosyltransferase involved in cell wall biosynthesis
MKILQIHKFYSKKKGGGSVTAFFEMIKLLEKNGHKVSVFSMDDPINEKTPYQKYFTENFDLNAKMSLSKKVSLAFKIIYNREAEKKIEQLIVDEKPNIAHLHNIYHYLSPSILRPLKKHNIPIVLTLHAYKEICPNYLLYINGKICEKCKGAKFYNCFFNRCIKDSQLASFLGMIEAYFHRIIKSYDAIDLFLAPSNFIKNKYEEFRIDPKRIIQFSNPFNLEKFAEFENIPKHEKNYFLYYGRLSHEKGIDDLIRAVYEIKKIEKLSGNMLYIVGQGAERKHLDQLTYKLGLNDDVKFLGPKLGRELFEIVHSAKFCVVPSVWYENSPMVIVESQLLKCPVIASDLGGSKELIDNSDLSPVFKAGDVSDLARKIKQLLALSPEERNLIGEKARKKMLQTFEEKEIYNTLINIYTDLLNKKKTKKVL